MPIIRKEHFERAAADIGEHGDNDTLPFDVDTAFISVKGQEVAATAYALFDQLIRDGDDNNRKKLDALTVFNERLLTPTGNVGFRVTTKIHPFWNVYLNGLGNGIAEALEDKRSDRVQSYRYLKDAGRELFDRTFSWKAFREVTVAEASAATAIAPDTMIVQTDISSFYERISHHHLQNLINDLCQGDRKIGNQIVALLHQFSAGRSFGLPVGGQSSRILAELFLNAADHQLTSAGIVWFRYVDDYILVANSNAEAYKALCTLSFTLADYGLALNKTKTIILTSKHYCDYVKTQLGGDDEEAGKLKEINLHFDPYSDTSIEDYESLRTTVESLQVQKLLNRELEKAVPDTFLVTQISRTLSLQEPATAKQLVTTLLSKGNLHAFRASWSTIMRGIAKVRATPEFEGIGETLDVLLDFVPAHSAHLLQSETNLLHYLRTLRFRQTASRSKFVHSVYEAAESETVKRACIVCWRDWGDRTKFNYLRNRWNQLSPECQRLVWLMSYSFGDEGSGFRRQLNLNIDNSWSLGIEKQGVVSYSTLYRTCCDDQNPST